MPQRTGLGKGLDALIPGGDAETQTVVAGGVQQTSVESIARNPRQPRVQFDAGELEELAASIREHGIIQPLIVSPGRGGNFTLIAGERRLQAAKRAGLKTVPIIVRQASDRQLLELALIENIQRADLGPLEEAEAYQHLVQDFGLSQEQVAERVGKSRVAVTNTLRLLGLSAKVKQALVDKHITEGHARALLGLTSAKAQEAALQTVLKLGMSVRQTEGLVRRMGGEKPKAKPKPRVPADVLDVERKLRSSLGTKVVLKHGKKGGAVTIYYYSDEELDTLLERLL
ncbi:MAG: chromosome partitioning protein ParB [Anaerolineaceae bacterium]|nr:ParB/RepB/Spo0J family partition protein [Anaerolineae bacterium]MBL1172053.1 ParB/RepB/Spo0J family partition protein [Chloroflexota bacterium]MDL1925679.1 ParB/RepB/Spo0J family partition protein [Anaerolineae bacterium AMX1]WKZ54518.1 MAG: ParB/RepB/Spo0J family partition protein [Anaerolineales bacterium]GJQ39056.1 MAG: chromosome partitioning protein ParB [Anaerolineaceae bacterium]